MVATQSEIKKYITAAAKARGITPSYAIRVWSGEGRYAKASEGWQSTVVKKGKRETSYGPYQLLVGGGLGDLFKKQTGLDPKNANTWKSQVDFALDYAAKNGWSSWYGAKANGVSKWDGLKGAKAIGIGTAVADNVVPPVPRMRLDGPNNTSTPVLAFASNDGRLPQVFDLNQIFNKVDNGGTQPKETKKSQKQDSSAGFPTMNGQLFDIGALKQALLDGTVDMAGPAPGTEKSAGSLLSGDAANRALYQQGSLRDMFPGMTGLTYGEPRPQAIATPSIPAPVRTLGPVGPADTVAPLSPVSRPPTLTLEAGIPATAAPATAVSVPIPTPRPAMQAAVATPQAAGVRPGQVNNLDALVIPPLQQVIPPVQPNVTVPTQTIKTPAAKAVTPASTTKVKKSQVDSVKSPTKVVTKDPLGTTLAALGQLLGMATGGSVVRSIGTGQGILGDLFRSSPAGTVLGPNGTQPAGGGTWAAYTPGGVGYTHDPNTGVTQSQYGYSFTTNPDGTSNVYWN